MFDEWRFQRKLSRWQTERRVTKDKYAARGKAARAESPDAYERCQQDYFAEQDEIDDSIAELEHDRMIGLAERYGIDVAPRNWSRDSEPDEDWQRSAITGRYFISRKEVARLRSAVRQEQKERFEQATRWVPPALSFMSLVVAILALLINGYDKLSRTAPSPAPPPAVSTPAR